MTDFSVKINPSANSLAASFLRGDLPKFLQREINRLAFSVERYSKQLTPVKSGKLRGSIHTSPETFGLRAIVATRTDYAIFVHDGTKYMRSRPFMVYGARFAQIGEFKDINKRLDKHFTDNFKYRGFR